MAVYSGGTLCIDLSSPSTRKGSFYVDFLGQMRSVDFLLRIRAGETQRACKLTISNLYG